ncbi:MFS transporter [Streptomyces europaeiscabiei]|uniref:MFS transporter n=1 Tax=Streptomyces europaeiscabiei TaxID=146819 RepID=UPI0019694CF3|nr:MFS transporter [Streptomyces europaeiscabiei]
MTTVSLMGVLVVGQMYVTIPLMPELAAAWGVRTESAALSTTAFAFAHAAGSLISGPLATRWGRRTVMVTSVLAMAVVTALLPLVTSLGTGVALRALQGLFAGSFIPMSYAYLHARMAPHRVALALTVVSACMGATVVIGQAEAQLVASLFGWTWVFWGTVPLLLVGAAVSWRVLLPQERGDAGRAEPAAAVGAVAAAGLATLGIIGGLFSYEAPSRDGSGPEDIRAGIPEAAAGAKTSPAATPSLTASTAFRSATASTSPTASPTESLATPTGSGTPTKAPSNSDATVTTAPAPPPTAGQPPVLGLGDQGTEVTELQLRLRQIGFYNGDADGDYDPEVQSAVRGYQLTRVLLEDESGVYGEATRTSLESETSEP